MQKIIYLAILLLMVFSLPFQADANDTDLYILTQVMQQVPPDALIILDLSGSMGQTPGGQYLYINPCDSSGQHCSGYSQAHQCGDDDIPYYPTDPTGGAHRTQCDMGNGGSTYWGNPTCAGPFYRHNATNSSASQTDCRKLVLAKNAIFTFLDYSPPPTPPATAYGNGTIDVNDVNGLNILMGYMRFYDCSNPESSINYNSGCNTLIYPFGTSYSRIYCNSSSSCTRSSSGSSPSVASESASGGTPLAAALQEALKYFNDSKTGDAEAACRQKFAVLITDGADTYACSGSGQETQSNQYKRRRETVAQARALANAGYYVFVVGFGSNMPYYQQNALNWTAYYGNTSVQGLASKGPSPTGHYPIPYGMLYPSTIPNPQQCYTENNNAVSQASDGHYYLNANATANDPGEQGISGYAFIAQNATDLQDAVSAIRNFIISILAQSTSYVAPVVPISQYQSTSSENSMYLGMFKPTTNTFWKGNIKKYGIATANTDTLSVGEVIDANNQLVMTSQNTIKDSALSFWSSTTDGGEVEKGGVGAVLLSGNPDTRNIYTYLGTNTDLTNSSNLFTLSNTAITPAKLNVSTTQQVQNIIKFVRGWDVWNWNDNGNNGTEKRDWILGAFIHSRPLVIHYSDKDVIYAGANDGMLHAFDNSNGNELWAFIPPNLLPNLQNFNGQLSLQIFVDGSPKAYVGPSQTILIFGERRGGNRYYALDVTNHDTPRFLWEINPNQIIYGTTITNTNDTNGYPELGQTWSTPMLGQIKNGSGTKWVAFIGGGYDNTYVNSVPAPAEDTTPPGTDTSGRAVYVVDITNGSRIWKYSYSNNSAMRYCIPSDIAALDANGDGLIERLYVGDTGGQIWRFDIGDMSDTASWSGKMIFTASGKIFYPPDVTLENDSGNYEMLFFGTGDREKPYNTSSVNTLYALKDKNPATPYTESSDLVDVTQDLLQDPNASTSDKINLLNQLKQKNGWYIRLSQNSGEKCDAPVVVLAGAAYFTSFTPTPASGSCTIGTGQGRTYILKYKTGNAAFNLDASNDVEGSPVVISRTDRSMNIGLGIPSGIIISVIGDAVVGYGGVAGGVFSPQLPITRAIVPTGWRIVF